MWWVERRGRREGEHMAQRVKKSSDAGEDAEEKRRRRRERRRRGYIIFDLWDGIHEEGGENSDAADAKGRSQTTAGTCYEGRRARKADAEAGLASIDRGRDRKLGFYALVARLCKEGGGGKERRWGWKDG